MSHLVTQRYSRDEQREVLGSLACALRCMTEVQTFALFPDDAAQIGSHRRRLTLLYWELYRAEPEWAPELEEELTLLGRLYAWLMIQTARCLGAERTVSRRLARDVRRQLARKGGYERFWDGEES